MTHCIRALYVLRQWFPDEIADMIAVKTFDTIHTAYSTIVEVCLYTHIIKFYHRKTLIMYDKHITTQPIRSQMRNGSIIFVRISKYAPSVIMIDLNNFRT